jgi:hypothetical protein
MTTSKWALAAISPCAVLTNKMGEAGRAGLPQQYQHIALPSPTDEGRSTATGTLRARKLGTGFLQQILNADPNGAYSNCRPIAATYMPLKHALRQLVYCRQRHS